MIKLEQQTKADMDVENSCHTSTSLHNDPSYGSCQTKSCEADLTSSTEEEKSSCPTASYEANKTSSIKVEKTDADCMTSQEISTILKHNLPPLLSFSGNGEQRSVTPPRARSKRFLHEFEIFTSRKRHALNIFNQPHINAAKMLKELVLHHGRNAPPEIPKYQKMGRDNLVNDQLDVNSLLKTGYLEELPVKYKEDKVVSAVKFETHVGAASKNQNNNIYLKNGTSLYASVQKLKTNPLDSVVDNIAHLLENNHFKERSKSSVCLQYICENGGGNQLIGKSTFHFNTHLANRLTGLSREGSNGSSSFFNRLFSSKDPITEENLQTQIVDTNVNSLDSAKIGSINSGSTLPIDYSSVAYKSSMIEATSERRKWLLSSSNLAELDSPNTQREIAVQDGPRKRTSKMHQTIFMELQDGAELFYMSNRKKMLKGYKRENGIFCCCCKEVVCPSKFEAHAGFSSKRQPYRGIYTASGLSLSELAILRLNKNSMILLDMESEREEKFVSCTNCNKPFDTGLLKSPNVPADIELLCLSCKQNTRPRRTCTQRQVIYKEFELNLKRIMKLPKDIACILCNDSAFETGNEFSPSSFVFCGQCERLYHVGCLKGHGICDLQKRPIPWFSWLCSPDCKEVHMHLKRLVKSSPHDIHSSSTSHTLKKLFEERGLSSQNEHEVKWQLLSGSNKTRDNASLFSKAATIFTEAFGPILEDGNDLIPAMVNGGELSKQHFGGMHCAVITRKSEVVSACLLRVFGRDLAELPLVATDKECHGMGYFKTLLYIVEQLLMTLKVKTLVLPVDEEAQLFWIDRFGFSRMSNDQAKLYAEEHWIVRFKKKIMLEKSVPQFQS